MFILKSEIQFDCAHYLSNYVGKCNNLHGHRYRLIVKVASGTLHQEGQLRGMVDDFGNIKAALKKIDELFDHKLLIEDNEEGRAIANQLDKVKSFNIVFVPYRPTAEEMARHIYAVLKEAGTDVCEVELFETPTNSCVYRENV